MTDGTVSREQIISFIKAGIQAPSGDNLQPWRFKLLCDGFELYPDKRHLGLFLDDKGIATYMSCGALIENVTLCALEAGYSIESDQPTEEECLVRMRFTRGMPEKQDISSEAIFARCTDRRFYMPRQKIPEQKLSQLNSVFDTGAFHLHWYKEPQQRRQVIKAVTMADSIRYSHERLHCEFHKALRFGKAAQQARDGLADRTLGIESFFFPVLKMLGHWGITRSLNRIGLHYVIAFRGTRLPMMSAPHVVSIIHPGPSDNLESGRIMQRFWLKLTELGISAQPLAVLPLFLARLYNSLGEGFTPKQIETLHKLDRQLMAITPNYDSETDQLVMIFRLGYSKTPPSRANRRPVETFLM
jgi:nitroreductase